MKLEHLELFTKLKAYDSLNKAGEELYISHQALSKIITSLEKQFGTTLLQRTANGISFTEDGIYLCNQLETILSSLNNIQLQLKTSYAKKIHGTITLYTDLISNAQILPVLLPYFEIHYPLLTFDIHLTENFNNIPKDISNGIGIFSTLNPPQNPPLPTEEFQQLLLQEAEVLLITNEKEMCISSNSSVIINERNWGNNQLLIDSLSPLKIYYVKSQHQCYTALENQNTYTLELSKSHINHSQNYITHPLPIPLFLTTHAYLPKHSSDFVQLFYAILKNLLLKDI